MDAARAADASDPDLNYHFRRRWSGPPLKRGRPPMDSTVERAEIGISSSTDIATIFEKFKHLAGVAG